MKGTFTVAAVADMEKMLSAELWGVDAIDARYYTARFNVGAIQTLRVGNTTKYRFMVLAFTAQALSIFLLAASSLRRLSSDDGSGTSSSAHQILVLLHRRPRR